VSAPPITLAQVQRRYSGHGGVEDVSLTLPGGRVTAVLGASGSGKTTLLRLIAGLEPLDRGAIHLGDRLLSEPRRTLAPEQRRIGLVFQEAALFPHLSAARNVAFGLRGEPAARLAAARGWLARVGLAHRADAYPHALSGGEQQRVALARALAPQPQAVLLDEPFSGLDPVLRADLRALTLHTLREAGATALFVTHDAEEALFVADHLVILHRGRLLQSGAPRAVYEAPASVDAAAALGPVNVFRGEVRRGVLGTPFLSLAAPGLAEGAAAVGVVRVERLTLTPEGAAEVVEVRPLGGEDLVLLRAEGGVWRVRCPVGKAPPLGARVGVQARDGGAHVFPA
jgi:iron(III) transport system ATP-binding protein